MSQIVHANFKSVGPQPFAELLWSRILAFRNEVERGSKAKFTFQFHQLAAARQPFLSLDIVGQHDGKLLSIRPSRPSFRRLSRSRTNGPRAREPPFPSLCTPSPQSDSKRPRQKRFNVIVSVPLPHGQTLDQRRTSSLSIRDHCD